MLTDERACCLVSSVSSAVEEDDGPAMRLIKAMEARAATLGYIARPIEEQRCRLLRKALRYRDKEMFFALLGEPA